MAGQQKVLSNGATTQQPRQSQNQPPVWLRTENVYLFVPNIIGYVRVVLASISLLYMPIHPLTCTVLYGVSCILDALDGYAARKFSQSTKFGAVLDMVTDRCTTSCLLMFLSSAYPEYKILFQFLLSLDLASHYMHMYAMMERGAGSHKSVDRKQSFILNLYYTNRSFLFIMCAMNELHFVSLYLYSFFSEREKQMKSQQPPETDSHYNPVLMSIAWWMAAVTFVFCAGKQVINFVQMARAAQTLVNIDMEARIQAKTVGQVNGVKEE